MVTMIVGNLLVSVAFIVMSQANMIWLFPAATLINGIGVAAWGLGSLLYMLKVAGEAGIPNSEQAKGMVSSMCLSIFFMGKY